VVEIANLNFYLVGFGMKGISLKKTF